MLHFLFFQFSDNSGLSPPLSWAVWSLTTGGLLKILTLPFGLHLPTHPTPLPPRGLQGLTRHRAQAQAEGSSLPGRQPPGEGRHLVGALIPLNQAQSCDLPKSLRVSRVQGSRPPSLVQPPQRNHFPTEIRPLQRAPHHPARGKAQSLWPPPLGQSASSC